MRIKDVPIHPAYLVHHDHFMNGAMDVYPRQDLAAAQAEAKSKNDYMDSIGVHGGQWRAYEKLPRVKIWQYHPLH